MHTIAAKAVTAEEALTPEFRAYIRRVVENSRAMAAEFTRMGYEVVTGGTDNHMFLLDFTRTHPAITGQMVQQALDSRAITLNKKQRPRRKTQPHADLRRAHRHCRDDHEGLRQGRLHSRGAQDRRNNYFPSARIKAAYKQQ